MGRRSRNKKDLYLRPRCRNQTRKIKNFPVSTPRLVTDSKQQYVAYHWGRAKAWSVPVWCIQGSLQLKENRNTKKSPLAQSLVTTSHTTKAPWSVWCTEDNSSNDNAQTLPNLWTDWHTSLPIVTHTCNSLPQRRIPSFKYKYYFLQSPLILYAQNMALNKILGHRKAR